MNAVRVVFILGMMMCIGVAGAQEDAGARPRIISLYAGHTEVLLRLGAREHIVGVSRQETYQGPETAGWSAPTFSVRDDVERFLAARPDIVLVRPQHAAGALHLVRALERAGVRVVALQVTRAEELAAYWLELARLVGREGECQAMTASFQEETDRFARAAREYRDKPGVFIEAIHREIKTFTPDSLPMWVLETAGGRNVSGAAKPASPGVIIAEYGPERLLGVSDQIELFLSQEGAMNRSTREEIISRSLYRTIPAIQNGRVHKIPEAILSRPTPSLLDGIRCLAELTGLAAWMAAHGEEEQPLAFQDTWR